MKEGRRFEGADGLMLAADAVGDRGTPPVLFLHGGGQTRRSWKRSLAAVAKLGWCGIAYDARGHGESDWSIEGDYQIEAFARDLAAVIAQLDRAPILIGASLGGITALLLEGERQVSRGLVLVDVAPRINPRGVDRILAFMAAAPEGFASLEAAAAAVANYNPERARPPSTHGIAANLRLRDGRYYWHWDPAFLKDRREGRAAIDDRIEAAARRVAVPALLIHAGRSDVVTISELTYLRDIMPDCRYVEIPAAGHMVAGDDNDAFNVAIVNYLTRQCCSPTSVA